MDTQDLPLAAVAGAVARIDARIRRKLRKRAQRQLETTYQDVIAQAEARITERLRKCAHKHGLTDREADALAETWKQAVKKPKHWKPPLSAPKPPDSGTTVGS
jgi:hypothetical protein